MVDGVLDDGENLASQVLASGDVVEVVDLFFRCFFVISCLPVQPGDVPTVDGSELEGGDVTNPFGSGPSRGVLPHNVGYSVSEKIDQSVQGNKEVNINFFIVILNKFRFKNIYTKLPVK